MKKPFSFVTLLTASLLVAALLSACGSASPTVPAASGSDDANAAQEITEGTELAEDVEISLWTFPVGNWGNPTTVGNLLAGFHQEYPNIHVSIEYLAYDTGDAQIEQALAKNAAPDLVFEGPERLVATWGAKGLMADLSDLWDAKTASAIYENVRNACKSPDGAYYEFPLCMTAHCMAINYDMFEAAGALQYIDEKTHTWTTEGFINAVQALADYGVKTVGVVYCKSQGGDQGTRALVNNLYGGSFTDEAHTVYTVDSAENIRALQTLYDLESITFEPSFTGVDAINQFCNKESAMSFCWNVSQEIQQTINNPNFDFSVFPMAFPSDDKPRLPGGIWGFGIFNNGNEKRIEAAKTLIRYMTENDDSYRRAVLASTYWPVRDVGNIYENDMLMTEYSIFTPYMDDYYQVTPNWPNARTAWWQMLQKVGEGMDVAEAVKGFPAVD